MSSISLPTITVRGTDQQMGHAQGETYRSLIQQFIQMRFDAAVTYFAAAGRGTVDELRLAGHASYALFQAWGHGAVVEHNAIAEAAGVDPKDLYTAANYTDMRDAVILAGTSDNEGCSSVLLPKSSTTGTTILAGQTWDLNPQDIDYVLAVHRVPDNGLETWAITVAGCPTLVGMNETGLMIGTTNIKTWGARPGIGYMSILHRMLSSSTAQQASRIVERTHRAGAHTYWIATSDTILEYEVTPDNIRSRHSQTEAIIRTNHTLHPAHQAVEWQPPSSSSRARLARLTSRMKEQRQDLHTLRTAFADRSDGVDSVNRYVEDEQGTQTNAVMIGEPVSRTVWACRGPADRGEWVSLAFEREHSPA